VTAGSVDIHGKPFTWRVAATEDDFTGRELYEGTSEDQGVLRGQVLPFPGGPRPWVWEVASSDGNRVATGLSSKLTSALACVETIVSFEEHDWEDKP